MRVLCVPAQRRMTREGPRDGALKVPSATLHPPGRNRKIGFPCPRGHGRATKHDEPCRGKVRQWAKGEGLEGGVAKAVRRVTARWGAGHGPGVLVHRVVPVRVSSHHALSLLMLAAMDRAHACPRLSARQILKSHPVSIRSEANKKRRQDQLDQLARQTAAELDRVGKPEPDTKIKAKAVAKATQPE